MRKPLIAAASVAVFVLVGAGVFALSSHFSSGAHAEGHDNDRTAGRVEQVRGPFTHPDHDWEVDPVVPDGKPDTAEELAEDAREGDTPYAPTLQGPVGGSAPIEDDGVVILGGTADPQEPGHR
ncbi:hypothetical protein IU447_11295 [Nocardia farcinica]|uniref:hypothetical protein n=1 Tax=Nocardia farcinica TaxID=37329 RepID=UPI0018951ADF|nr:hypothetical protein [Nocardia farcinica]MBF6360702.1 hypothetical protein [Nocardia farcinica]